MNEKIKLVFGISILLCIGLIGAWEVSIHTDSVDENEIVQEPVKFWPMGEPQYYDNYNESNFSQPTGYIIFTSNTSASEPYYTVDDDYVIVNSDWDTINYIPYIKINSVEYRDDGYGYNINYTCPDNTTTTGSVRYLEDIQYTLFLWCVRMSEDETDGYLIEDIWNITTIDEGSDR